MSRIIFTLLFSILLYYMFLVYQQVYWQYKEREYYEKQYVIDIPENSKTELKFIDYLGIPITLEKTKEDKEIKPFLFKINKETKQEKKEITIPEVFWEGKLVIPNYVESDIIIPDNITTLNNDLKKGVVWNPYTRKIYERGIMFLQGHSGSNWWNFKYNYLDKLSLYYEDINDLEAYISMEGYIFKYRLEKKEIVNPGESNLIEKNKHNLVLMTCYPRNTTKKRALFYFVLEDVYGGDI